MNDATLHHQRESVTTLGRSSTESVVLGALQNAARLTPHRAVLAEVGPRGVLANTLTCGQLLARANTLASDVRNAVPSGSVLLVVGPSGPDLAVWLVAALLAGVHVLPASTQLVAAELGDLAQRSAARAVVAPPALQHVLPDLPCLDWGMASVEASGVIAAVPPRSGGAIVLLSSGTTGRSKLVVRPMQALDADAMGVVHALGLTAEDCILMATPLSHSYGIDMLLGTLLSGAQLHTTQEFDPVAITAHLTSHCTVFPGVPFSFEALAPLGCGKASARLRLAFSAGGPLPDQVRADFERAWKVPVGDLYGASELGTVTFNDPAAPLHHRGSVGCPLPGVSLRILDPDDTRVELPAGHEGHIAIAAPSMLSHCLDGDVPFAGRHLLTGDLGTVDHLGRLFVTGRLKLLIDAGGTKVNPLEVEMALRTHPDIVECLVLPLRVTGTVSRLRALFVPRDPAHPPTTDQLRSHLSDRLSAAKVPRLFCAVPSLPKAATGKVLRAAAAELYP